MASGPARPPLDRLLVTAEVVARERPGVDPELGREVFQEAARLLDDGLALDGLDPHDADARRALVDPPLVGGCGVAGHLPGVSSDRRCAQEGHPERRRSLTCT